MNRCPKTFRIVDYRKTEKDEECRCESMPSYRLREFGGSTIFRCVHASLYEDPSVRRSIPFFFFRKLVYMGFMPDVIGHFCLVISSFLASGAHRNEILAHIFEPSDGLGMMRPPFSIRRINALFNPLCFQIHVLAAFGFPMLFCCSC